MPDAFPPPPAVRLDQRVEVTMGRQRSPREAVGEHLIPYLRAANVKDGALDLSTIYEMNFTPVEQQKFALQRGDVLVTEGCGSLDQIGASARWDGEIDGPVAFQNTLLRLRAVEGLSDAGFVYQWARWAFEGGHFAAIANGTSIFHIGERRASAMPFPDFSLTEQRRVGSLLNLIDEATERSQAEVDASQKLMASLRERLFDSRHRPPRPLREFLVRIEGGRSLDTLNRPPESGERAVLKVSAVRPGLFLPRESKALPHDAPMPERARVHEGDILITRANTSSLVGAVCCVDYTPRELFLSDKTLRLVFDEQRAVPRLFVHALATTAVREQLALVATGTSASMKNVSQAKIAALAIHVPTELDEQRRLTELLDSGLRVTRTLTSRTAELKRLRSAVMCALFTGHQIPEPYDRFLRKAPESLVSA